MLGGGLAGLAAARVCAEAGLSVVVLEASDRVGGRIRTVRASSEDGKEVIELGAEFVHGRAAELWDLIEEAGLATYERVGAFLHRGKQGLEPLEGDEEDATEGLKDYAGPDCSFAEYVGRLGLSAEVERRRWGMSRASTRRMRGRRACWRWRGSRWRKTRSRGIAAGG